LYSSLGNNRGDNYKNTGGVMSRVLPAKPPILSDEAYGNVCNCKYSSEDDKIGYLNAMQNCLTASDAPVRHRDFCIGNEMKGPRPTDLLPDEGLGVFAPAAVFHERVAESTAWPYSKLKGRYEAWLRYEDKRHRGVEPLQDEIEAATTFRKCRAPIRAFGFTWLFRNPERRRLAFDRLSDEWLGARLGLSLVAGERRLTFGFLASSVERDDGKAVIPTFLDSDWGSLPKWHWSGKTKPLLGTPPGYDGLEEVVAPPPSLSDLIGPVIEIEPKIP
jgi:hypothetical protein